MADNNKIYKKLPAVFQTTAIKNFFENTVQQLFSAQNAETVQGYIGSPSNNDIGAQGKFLSEPTVTKQFYGLSPTVNTINTVTGNSENFYFYDELIDTLKTYGVDTHNHNKLFSENFLTFMPPINVDKMVNYQEYYWYPQGPSTISVEGTLASPIDVDRDVLGETKFVPPNGKEFRNGMIVKFVGDYVTPVSKINKEYIVVGVGESIQLLPKIDNFATTF